MFNLINKFWGTNETTKTNEPALEDVTVSKVTANEKISETKDGHATVGDVFKIFGKIFMGGAVFLGIDCLTGITGIAGNLLRFGTSRISSRDNSTALTTYKTGELTPLDKNNINYDKPSSANNVLTKNFLDEEVSSSASEWVEGFKKEKLPAMKIVESATSSSGDNSDKSVIQRKYIGRKLMASEADEPLTLINNTLNIEVGETVVLTNENLATNSISNPADLIYTVSEVQHGQFETVSNGTIVTSFTQQAINNGEIQFQDDGGFFAPMWKVNVSDGQTASDPEYAIVNFVYNCPTKIGHEFQVNTYFIDEQTTPLVANLDDGKFVIVWASNEQDGSGYGVFGQIFNPDGIKYGTEFQVNTFTNYDQYVNDGPSGPVASGLADNKFVVLWTSNLQDGSEYGIFGQIFYNNGVKYGSELQVNTYIDIDQDNPSVIRLTNDKFVTAWESYEQDGSYNGIYAQIFYNNGMKYGSEFRVNTYTNSEQKKPAIANLTDNNFVVVWHSYGQDNSTTSSYGVFGQILYNNGIKYGSEFQVNTYTDSHQEFPSVTGLTDDKFAVAWESYGQDGSYGGIYAQIFYNNGTKYNSEFRANTYISYGQHRASSTKLSNNKFAITWYSDMQDGDDYGIYGQVFYNNGTKYNDEFQVNTYTKSHQNYPSVAGLPDDKFVVTWQSSNQTTNASLSDIYAQLFSVNNHSPQLINNQLIIQGNKISVLSSEQLSATDQELLNEELKFLMYDIQHVRFQLLDNETIVEGISDFTQKQITDGKIRFIYTGNYTESALPSYKISVTDGKLLTSPVSAKITLTSHNNTTLFIAIAAGAVGLAALIGGCLGFWKYELGFWKYKKTKNKIFKNEVSMQEYKQPKPGRSTSAVFESDGDIQIVRNFSPNEIKYKEKLGKGTFATVWKGRTKINSKQTIVAIKKLNSFMLETDPKVLKGFKTEITIMQNLVHPNIVKLYGISFDENENQKHYCIIMEFMPRGDLANFIHDTNIPAPWKSIRWGIVTGITKGLAYLHKNNVLHRDLKPANILLTENFAPKITDFGISKILKLRSTSEMTGDVGTPAYMAPELIKLKIDDITENYNEKADVYSFGIILWEIFVREKPYNKRYVPFVDILKPVKNEAEQLRPKVPKTCPKFYADLIRKCWAQRPKARPTMEAVETTLPDIKSQMMKLDNQ